MNQLSQNILKLRKSANLTQEQLAAELGVTPQSVSNWERGGAPDISLLPVLANFFSVTIDELMGNDEIGRQEPCLAFRQILVHSVCRALQWSLLHHILIEEGQYLIVVFVHRLTCH